MLIGLVIDSYSIVFEGTRYRLARSAAPAPADHLRLPARAAAALARRAFAHAHLRMTLVGALTRVRSTNRIFDRRGNELETELVDAVSYGALVIYVGAAPLAVLAV